MEYKNLSDLVEEQDLPVRVEFLFWNGERRIELVVEGVDLAYGHRGAIILVDKAIYACNHMKPKLNHCHEPECENYIGKFVDLTIVEISLRDGKKILAVKEYRALTDLPFRQCIEDVSKMEEGYVQPRAE